MFFFYLYCFLGWCFESAYVSLKTRKLTNRGFMRGPFLPLYGSGAIMMLVVSAPFQDNLLLTYFAGVVGATVLEYITGVTMEALFKVRYWDYSEQPLNFQGHICLGTSLAWGFLTIGMTRFIHQPIAQAVLMIPENTLTVLTMFLTVGVASDFTMAFRAAMDLRDILVRMEKIKAELENMQKKLDGYLDFETVKNRLSRKVSGTVSGIEDLTASIGDRLELIREKLDAGKASAALQGAREEIEELQRWFAAGLQKHLLSSDRQRSDWRRMFRGNPTMTSVRFKEVLEELKRKDKEDKGDK